MILILFVDVNPSQVCMDTSDEYIKMCRAAKEIQTLRQDEFGDHGVQWSEGDFFYAKKIIDRGMQGDYVRSGIAVLSRGYPYIPAFRESIWLPRQDQLQELITNKGWFRFSLIELFYHFANKAIIDGELRWSMEQLWLAFVMEILFNKTWTGEKWD